MGPGPIDGPDEFKARRERDVAALLTQISYLEEEIGLLRRKVADSPRQARALVQLLERYASDATSSWHLGADGTWTRHHRDAEGRPLEDIQDHLLRSRALGRPTV